NVVLSDRWDRWYRFFLVSPNMHRVHHSRRMVETNSNYASGLAIWDRLFGSYRERSSDEIVFGLEYDRTEAEQKWLYLLKRPFRPRGRPDSEGE
ncbi:MAG: sterol desaturase family protein, partial [Opitutales bacterium]|nr:sterol desaturase family protein [Opitutales bacterium]